MLISVIIPTYNEAKYIGHCLASLQVQNLTYGDHAEIIVIDDGSTDQTVSRIKRFISTIDNHDSISLLHQNHRGPAIARNNGVKVARGDIIVLVDADMEFDADFIKHLVAPIKGGQTKGTFSKQEMVLNWDKAWARCWNWNENLHSKHRLPLNHPDIGTDFRAILKSEFTKVDGYDDIGYTDTWTLPAKLGYRPVNAPGAIFYHHNPDTISEVFKQSKWVAKRKYKLGIIGTFVALARASLPISILIGLIKTIKHREPTFIFFKITYDLGATLGIIDYNLTRTTSK